MDTNNEITALLQLLDDPDQEVFDVVSEKIVDYGKPIIPNLEHLWETTPEEHTQERIELLIHRLHFKDLTEDFRQWNISGHHDLMLGALLVAKFQYPDLSTTPVLQEIEKIRRNIWLELNNYLTPLEQVNIVTSILYSYYGLKGSETNYTEPNEFLLHKTLEAKRGNQISNGILYLLLCELLDIPVRAIHLPKQFVIAYFKPGYSEENLPDPLHKVEFFIDPTSGQVFTHQDVESYLKRISVHPVDAYFKPQMNKQVIIQLLEEFAKCFDNEKEFYKQKELLELASLLD
ncbi:transglutaminase family protein [Terrimonas pollutisoli]|uniref:transglutaminase family protein n=1 Tax=Terrimonas pollutisoli TaxID=3034147 RepID=UPI0023EDC9AD|nr:transglutaminase family protein [Terrimonas sp. H1YJ31]